MQPKSLKITFQTDLSECSRIVPSIESPDIGRAIADSIRYCCPQLPGCFALEILLSIGNFDDTFTDSHVTKLHAIALAWDQWSGIEPFNDCIDVSINLSKLIGDSWTDEDRKQLRERLESLGCRVD